MALAKGTLAVALINGQMTVVKGSRTHHKGERFLDVDLYKPLGQNIFIAESYSRARIYSTDLRTIFPDSESPIPLDGMGKMLELPRQAFTEFMSLSNCNSRHIEKAWSTGVGKLRARLRWHRDNDAPGSTTTPLTRTQEWRKIQMMEERIPLELITGKKKAPIGINADASFTDERVPLKNVHLNDDAAEKRRRRKSTKLLAPMRDVDEEAATPGRRQSSGHHLTAVEQTPAVRVPLDVMNTNFEEWMKMATDNKINVANAWNFALIDYFHDMSLLRNNADNSINFQKASCTLDGCVKIWTSRVDSVGTETGKLLSNLANESSNPNASTALSDNEDGEGGHGHSEKRKKARSAEATLAKSYAQLKVKKLDLEFTVDPLFKKTCADFDEGGAGGLLLNHLALGMGHEGSMRVVFDASDVAGADQEDEEDEHPEPENLVDLSSLSSYLPPLDSLAMKVISPSLVDFEYGPKDMPSFDDLTFIETAVPNFSADDDDDMWDGAADRTVLAADVQPDTTPEDFFTGDQAVGDDFGGGFDDMGGGDMGGMDMPHDPEDTPEREMEPGVAQHFDPRKAPNEKDLIMAMQDDDGDGMMDYFDQTFLKNWAGPEHWKLRKVVRKDIPNPNETANKTRREKKEAFRIDFLTPSEESIKDTNKKLFAPSTRGAGITLPALKKGKKREDQMLPDDMHFSSKQLIRLFLKPKFTLRMRGSAVAINERSDGEIDEQFWAQAAADQAAGIQNNDDMDDATGEGVMPFNTEFFHDDYDDGGTFGDFGDGVARDSTPPPDASLEGEQDLLAATEGQSRRVRPEQVNYAKRAKRVDVRMLKENIWKQLNIVTGHRPEGTPEPLSKEPELPPTDPTESRDFTTVISGLRSSYPREKMEEISTSFCFICLLHLANEQGLQINDEGQELRRSVSADVDQMEEEDVEEDIGEDKTVGDIWGLKIYRDPNATAAA